MQTPQFCQFCFNRIDIPTHLLLQRPLRGEASRPIPSANPALVLTGGAAEHAVAANGTANALNAHAALAVVLNKGI